MNNRKLPDNLVAEWLAKATYSENQKEVWIDASVGSALQGFLFGSIPTGNHLKVSRFDACGFVGLFAVRVIQSSEFARYSLVFDYVDLDHPMIEQYDQLRVVQHWDKVHLPKRSKLERAVARFFGYADAEEAELTFAGRMEYLVIPK